MPRIGVNTWVWTSPLTTAGFEELAPKISGMGFDMVEVPIETPNEFDYARVGEVAREHGLGVSACAAIGPDRDLIHPDESIRTNGMGYVRHCIEAARTLGATNLVGPLYSAVGRTWQSTADERARDTDLLVGQLGELSRHADGHGVVLCVEPLNRFETSFINLCEQLIEVVDRVGHPSCGILLDTFHMNIEERSLRAAIELAGPRLKHLHACENDRGAPGSGHVPWGDVVEGCRAIGYQGPIVIESFTDKVKSIARAAAIWRSFAVSQDALAEDGLRFLRSLFGEPLK